jgi:hypothetical protein
MRLKLQKRSEWKFVSRIIPYKQVFSTPQLAAESVSKACFGVHTRDSEAANHQEGIGKHSDEISIPQDAEVPPNTEAKRIISYFSASLFYYLTRCY